MDLKTSYIGCVNKKGNYKNLFKLMTQPSVSKTLYRIKIWRLKALHHFENSTLSELQPNYKIKLSVSHV